MRPEGARRAAGLAGSAALFGARTLSRVERIVLTPALSLAVLALGGLLLYALGDRLNRGTWAGLTAAVTVVLAAVGYLRGRREARSRAGSAAPAGGPVTSGATDPAAEPEQDRPETVAPGRALWKLALLAATVVLLGGASWIGVHSANAQNPHPFTALSIVPDDDPDPGDQVRPVTIAVDSHETAETAYTLRVHSDSGDPAQFSFPLRPGEVWKRDLQAPVTGRLTADLFKGDGTTPYRTVFVSGLQ